MAGDNIRSLAVRAHDHSQTWESSAGPKSGTSFPGSPATQEEFLRTDIRGGMIFFWDGTYWLSREDFQQDASLPYLGITATDVYHRLAMPQDLDIYLFRVDHTHNLTTHASGTRWDIILRYVNSASGLTTIATLNTWSKVPFSGWRKWNDAYTTLISGAMAWALQATAVGTPGIMYGSAQLHYRMRAT